MTRTQTLRTKKSPPPARAKQVKKLGLVEAVVAYGNALAAKNPEFQSQALQYLIRYRRSRNRQFLIERQNRPEVAFLLEFISATSALLLEEQKDAEECLEFELRQKGADRIFGHLLCRYDNGLPKNHKHLLRRCIRIRTGA